MLNQFKRLLEPILNRIILMIVKSTIIKVKEGNNQLLCNVNLGHGEKVQDVEMLQQFGFVSIPENDAQAIVLCIGGDREHPIVISTDDENKRIQVGQGNSGMYNSSGTKITLIGNDVTIYHGVTFGGTSWSKGKRHPTIEDGVVVGAGAKLLGPITVGKYAKVGANSVVIDDVPEQQTVVGIPGRVVQTDNIASLNPYGIDLNHHLISDPVATAINCLVDRVQELEKALRI